MTAAWLRALAGGAATAYSPASSINVSELANDSDTIAATTQEHATTSAKYPTIVDQNARDFMHSVRCQDGCEMRPCCAADGGTGWNGEYCN